MFDGDESGQTAALRIAEKFFHLINEKIKFFFQLCLKEMIQMIILNKNGKEKFLEYCLKKKQIIQSFIWDHYLKKIDRNNPF